MADSVSALEHIWQEVVAEIYGGFVPNWTAKERGQMRQFREACPPGTAAPVLEACLREWALFGAMAKSNAAAWDVPSRPTVAVLLRCVGIAVNFWEAQTKPKILGLAKTGSLETAPNPGATEREASARRGEGLGRDGDGGASESPA